METDRQRNVTSIRPDKAAAEGIRAYEAIRNSEGTESNSFGLITVVRAEVMSPSESLRTVVISGTDGAAWHSAAEFSPSGSSGILLARVFQTDTVARGNERRRQISSELDFLVILRVRLFHAIRLPRWVPRTIHRADA